MEVFDLSGTQTVSPGRYHFDRICLGELEEKARRFVESITRHGQIMYDWGHHRFFACIVPFSVDFDRKVIVDTDGQPIKDEQWLGYDPDELHQLLAPIFSGDWGPTSVDTILRMENSGIKVSICGTSKFGPKDPRGFMEQLRQTMLPETPEHKVNQAVLDALAAGATVCYAPVSGKLVLLMKGKLVKEGQPTMQEFLDLRREGKIVHFDTMGQGHHVLHGRVDFYRSVQVCPSGTR